MLNTIKDPILGDYEIQTDGNSFNLVKNQMLKPDKETGEQKPTQKVVGYFSSVNGALTEAAKLVAHDNMQSVVTIREYIAELKNVNSLISKKFEEIG